jgi:hypothetical protein
MVPLSGRSNLDGWYLLYENSLRSTSGVFFVNKSELSNSKKGFHTSQPPKNEKIKGIFWF